MILNIGLNLDEAKKFDVLIIRGEIKGFYIKELNYPKTVDLITYLNENGVEWDKETTSWKEVKDEAIS